MKLNRTRTSIIALLLTIALLSTTLAVILIQKTINNTMHIQAVGDFFILKDDLETPVTAISWGVFYPGDNKSSRDILGSYIMLQPIGSKALKFTWIASGLDRDQWEINCTWNGAANTPFPEGSYQFSVVYPGVNGYLNFYLTSLNLTNSVEQDYSFAVTITATEA